MSIGKKIGNDEPSAQPPFAGILFFYPERI